MQNTFKASVHRPEKYVLGKPEQLTINVRVTNDAEDAFEATVFIPVPAGLLYNKFVEKENTSGESSNRYTAGELISEPFTFNGMKWKNLLVAYWSQRLSKFYRGIGNETNYYAFHHPRT